MLNYRWWQYKSGYGHISSQITNVKMISKYDLLAMFHVLDYGSQLINPTNLLELGNETSIKQLVAIASIYLTQKEKSLNWSSNLTLVEHNLST